jgi:hypothetical protein
MLILREIEQAPVESSKQRLTFAKVALDPINALLPAIQIVRADRGFAIQAKGGTSISEDEISSGESELIAQAIEVLVFSRSSSKNKLLLLDEPDVHLHPDLQRRFTHFVQKVSEDKDIRVVIATHSTAVIGAFSEAADLQIVPITSRHQTAFSPFKPSKIANEILPVFGVHPLSSAFNNTPVLLVEGDDDKRVVEQAVRSGNGRLRWAPCVVGSVTELAEWENWLNQVLPALYDNPRAYSLRDLDESSQSDIDDVGVVCRVRLNCYAIENLLLSDECLSIHGFTADSFKGALSKWSSDYPQHPYSKDASDFVSAFQNRRKQKIKDLRNIITALLGTNKPWEVVVGQLLSGQWKKSDNPPEHSVQTYLGPKAIEKLFNI